MKGKIFFVLFFVICICSSAFAQEQPITPTPKNNTVYASFGSYLDTYYMLHYDRILWRKSLWKIGANAGAAYFSEAGKNPTWAFSPGGSLLFGRTHHAELGLNYRFVTNEISQTHEFLPTFGYRFQRDKGGFFGSFRVGMSISKTNYDSGLNLGTGSRAFVQFGLGFTF